jgi:hypothetical protein
MHVARFMELLCVAHDSGEREKFRSLLIAEEDKYARAEEKLDAIRRCLSTCDLYIERMQVALAGLRDIGANTKPAEDLLSHLLSIELSLKDQLHRRSNYDPR